MANMRLMCFNLFLFSFSLLKSDCSGLGKCPKIENMSNFNLSRFTGHWYEIEKSFHLMEIVSNCVNIDLQLQNSEIKSLQVKVTSKSSWSQLICEFIRRIDYLRGMCYYWSKDKSSDVLEVRSHGITVSEGVATERKNNPASFSYRVKTDLPRMLSRYLPGTGVYQVIDTDYENYAILYSCSDIEFVYADLIWIWARQKEVNVTLRASVYEILEDKELDIDRLILADNKNCTD